MYRRRVLRPRAPDPRDRAGRACARAAAPLGACRRGRGSRGRSARDRGERPATGARRVGGGDERGARRAAWCAPSRRVRGKLPAGGARPAPARRARRDRPRRRRRAGTRLDRGRRRARARDLRGGALSALRAGVAGWAAIGVFAAILLLYAPLPCAPRGLREAGRARRHGVAGGLAVGAAWLAIVMPETFSKSLMALPLAAAPPDSPRRAAAP